MYTDCNSKNICYDYPMTKFPENHAYYEIVNNLLARLDYIRIQPETILIVGFEMECVVKKLQERYPSAQIKNIIDLKLLDQLENNSHDFIFSHFSLLNAREPLYLVQQFWRILREEGLLLLTSLGPDSFFELRESSSDFLATNFVDMHHVGDWLRQLHFSDPVVDREEIIIAYDNTDLLLEDLKIINSIDKNKWQAILPHYEKYKTENYFPVTLEIIYGHGWKIKIPENDDESFDEVFIRVDSIKLSKAP